MEAHLAMIICTFMLLIFLPTSSPHSATKKSTTKKLFCVALGGTENIAASLDTQEEQVIRRGVANVDGPDVRPD
jgi:hypothetical protein